MGTSERAPGAASEEWQLLAEAGAGRPESFAPLVERHQSRIVGLCERLLGDREEARDAAQEVFLKAFRHAGSARPMGQLSTWLHRIAVNHCFNRLRRRKVLRFISFSGLGDPAREAGPEAFDPPDGAADPEAALASRERWRRTRAAIDRLPAGQRVVLVLAKFEGMAYREIAEALGLTEGAVESRLVRAMRRLQAAQEGGRMRVPYQGERR